MSISQIFHECVKEFCSWAESESDKPEVELVKALHLLSRLYSNALMLKMANCVTEHEAIHISNEQWNIIFKRFGSLPFNYYPDVDDITEIETPSTSLGDVADDLADIYRDLKAGLWLYEQGYELEADYEWKFNFNVHWGIHAVNAMNALHSYAMLKNIEL
jgi:Domain of unknown function (DUF5063)